MLETARAIGDKESVAIGLLNMAMVAVGRKSARSAKALLVDAFEIIDAGGSKPLAQGLLDVCAGLAAFLDDSETAAWFYGAAEVLAVETGLRRDFADEAFLNPLIAGARARLGASAYQNSERAGEAAGWQHAVEAAKRWLMRAD